VTTPTIRFLYTNIGRGHPFYLDGIRAALRADPIHVSITDVFEASGPVGRRLWTMARSLYRRGSSPGPAATIYKRLRSGADYNRDSVALRMMRRSLTIDPATDTFPTVVAHPLLVAILRGHQRILYQHGEVVTPPEAVVRGAATVFVPTAEAAGPFLEAGYKDGQVVVTGPCIESQLLAQAEEAKRRRLMRCASEQPLTGAFFSSGAEPRVHVEKLVAAALSTATAGGTALVFAREHGWLHTHFVTAARQAALPWQVVTPTNPPLLHLSGSALILYQSREQLDRRTQHLFKYVDYVVSPAHERSNWALGLELPMYVLTPNIGPFAPRNHDLLLRHKACHTIEDLNTAGQFSDLLSRHRSQGLLLAMNEQEQRYPETNGFAAAARSIRSLVLNP
jgi:hypothetical protein